MGLSVVWIAVGIAVWIAVCVPGRVRGGPADGTRVARCGPGSSRRVAPRLVAAERRSRRGGVPPGTPPDGYSRDTRAATPPRLRRDASAPPPATRAGRVVCRTRASVGAGVGAARGARRARVARGRGTRANEQSCAAPVRVRNADPPWANVRRFRNYDYIVREVTGGYILLHSTRLAK